MAQLPSKLPFSKKRLRARIIISYILDYVFIIGFAVGFWALDAIEPYHQHFSLENKSLQYPFAVKERITIQEALLISIVSPLVIIVLYSLLIDGLFSHHKTLVDGSGRRKLTGPYRLKDRLWELNCGILGLLLSQGLAFVTTQILKNACGKPRPDLIDRCRPAPDSHDQPVFGLSNSTICTGDPALIKDGFRSWPSGHSSSSFAGLFYLSLYLSGKMHIMDKRGEVWKAIIVMVPILAATLIAVSRIMDARHHPFDVITGSLLGVFTAWASYRQYFPSLSEPWKKGRAYPIRSWGSEPRVPAGIAYSGTPDNDDTVPLRDGAAESSYAQARKADPGQEFSLAPQSQPVTPGVVYRNKHRDRDEYSASSSEDDIGAYEMTRPGERGRANLRANQPYDTAYYSPGRSASPGNNIERGVEPRHLAGEF
ncbi:PAP2 domain protein [Talaromyces stipitatus ATCC 10500]|uniref:PAP2 domain protein n=1 Tax=Talaromyces stipitatus (strain ATCC 10500 / CBS 375.48 / QM 6759 / NRRL 1006) TaxID=441959 RepID=B8ME62_TALSN|nr:PAP2 domain protein [Talaromyces stipitatus ATCC 10500]EED16489.1 PAP2 domain protein [Talaromyces stipitatus ATCC 10500]